MQSMRQGFSNGRSGMTISLSQAEAQLAKWLDADSRAAEHGSSVSVDDGGGVTNYTPAEIRSQLAYWKRVAGRLRRSTRRGAFLGGMGVKVG